MVEIDIIVEDGYNLQEFVESEMESPVMTTASLRLCYEEII
jgi:hypothetical protein